VQSTPLRGPKIGCILKVRIGPKAFPIYRAARLTRKTLGGSPLQLYRFAPLCLQYPVLYCFLQSVALSDATLEVAQLDIEGAANDHQPQ
jgi:hypothetical protein